MDMLLLLANGVGLVLGGVLGVLGTLSNTHSEESVKLPDGNTTVKKALNARGKSVIGLICIVTILAISGLYFEHEKERLDSIGQEEETQKLLAELKVQNEGIQKQGIDVETLLREQRNQAENFGAETRENEKRSVALNSDIRLQTQNTFDLLGKMQSQSEFTQSESLKNQQRAEAMLNGLKSQTDDILRLLDSAANQEKLAAESLDGIKKVIDRFHVVDVAALVEISDGNSTQISELKAVLSRVGLKQKKNNDGNISPPRQIGAQSYTENGELRWIGWDLYEERSPDTKQFSDLFDILVPELMFGFSMEKLKCIVEPGAVKPDGSIDVSISIKDDAGMPDVYGVKPIPGGHVCLRYDYKDNRLFALFAGFRFQNPWLKRTGRIAGINDLKNSHGIIVFPAMFTSRNNAAYLFNPLVVSFVINGHDYHFARFSDEIDTTVVFNTEFSFEDHLGVAAYDRDRIARFDLMQLYRNGSGEGELLTRPRMSPGTNLRLMFDNRFRERFVDQMDESHEFPKVGIGTTAQ